MSASGTAALAPIDPLRRPGRDGRYEDQLVVVDRPRRGPTRPGPLARSAHFSVWCQDRRIHLRHELPADRIDDDLTGLLHDELFRTGVVAGPELFERLFTGIVVAGTADPVDAWERFYRNTLLRLDAAPNPDRGPGGPTGAGGTLAGYAPVYAHAAGLVGPGSVLELGCCFGFLSLRLAATGRRVVASDLCPGTVRLLGRVAARLGLPLVALAADAGAVPLPTAAVDTVVAAHVIEHLTPAAGRALVDEAARVARRRVVIAVPDEHEPSAAYGHRCVVGADDLRALGDRVGWDADVHTHHGRWLVLDRRRPPPR